MAKSALQITTATSISALAILGCGYWLFYAFPQARFRERIDNIAKEFRNHKDAYVAKLVKPNASNGEGPNLSSLYIGESGGAVGANVFEHLVYDQSDEIVLSPLLRTPRWNQVARRELGELLNTACKLYIARIEGHFYAVISTC